MTHERGHEQRDDTGPPRATNRDNSTTRLVALSGYGQDAELQAALDAGFDEHVTKPPDPERLERLLAGVRPVVSAPSA